MQIDLFKCDQCKKTEETSGGTIMNNGPEGWISVHWQKAGSTDEIAGSRSGDFCSWACLQAFSARKAGGTTGAVPTESK